MKHDVMILTALAMLASACGDPIKDAQRIEELRVLGAQLEVDGDDTGSATPEPGVDATVTWLLAAPSGLPPETLWQMQVCVAADSRYGVPYCRDEPIAEVEQGALSNLAPSLSFTVPDNDVLDGASKLAVLAVFCDGGQLNPADNPTNSTCPGADTIQRASFDVFIGTEDSRNNNPDLSEATVELDGELWEPSPDGDCSADAVPMVPPDGREYSVTLNLTEAARETQPEVLDEVTKEALQISTLSTLGKLDRRFSDFAPDDTNLSMRVPWAAPGEISQTTPSTFYFVVRDGRGGTSWLTRTLCVEP